MSDCDYARLAELRRPGPGRRGAGRGRRDRPHRGHRQHCFGGEWTSWHQTSTEVAVSHLTPEQRQKVWQTLIQNYNSNADLGGVPLAEIRGVKKALFGCEAKVTIS